MENQCELPEGRRVLCLPPREHGGLGRVGKRGLEEPGQRERESERTVGSGHRRQKRDAQGRQAAAVVAIVVVVDIVGNGCKGRKADSQRKHSTLVAISSVVRAVDTKGGKARP